MYSFSEYLEHSSNSQISEFFKVTGPVLETRLTLENFDFEASLISKFEQTLPDSFGLHLDMILTGGTATVSQYYLDLSRTGDKVLEKLESNFKEFELQKVTEALTNLRNLLKEKYAHLNEQEIIDFDKKFGDITNSVVLDAAIKGVPDETKPKSDILATIKKFWNLLTDNGDPISILQLALDLAGLIPGPWGIAADAINAIIYAWNGKWLLACISLIAAVFPFAGDTFKLLKFGKSAKYADDFFQYIVKTPDLTRPNIKQYFERIPDVNKGPVKKVLSLISEKIVDATAKASSVLSRFINALSKYTGFFPSVQSFFKNLGIRFEKFAKRMSRVADDLRYLPETPLMGSSKVFSDLTSVLSPSLGKTGGKLSLDRASGMVRLYDTEGKLLREFSEKLLTDHKLWVNNASMTGFLTLGKNSGDIIKYFNALPKVAPKIKSTANKFLSTIHTTARAKVAISALIGKEIIKVLSGGKTPEEIGMPEEAVEFYGADFLNNAVQKKIAEEKEKGVKYVPFVTFDSEKDEDYQTVTKYQNDWAKVIGGPEVIPVLYNRAGHPELANEYNEFWDGIATKFGNEGVLKRTEDLWQDIAKGRAVRDESGKTIRVTPEVPQGEEKKILNIPNLKTVDWYREAFPQRSNEAASLISFNDFIV